MNRAANPIAASPTSRRVGKWITICFLLALAAALMWRGFGYYRLSLSARPGHPDYRALNPAGVLGHGYGILGTILIFTNLLYLVRRRFAKYIPDRLGSMPAWLNAHAFTGLTGALLVAFHSAFQLRTPVAALTSGSLGIVVLTGLVGFYLHALLPRSELKPLGKRLAEIEPLLPGFVMAVEDRIKQVPVTTLPHDASFLRILVTIPRWVLEARARRGSMRNAGRADKLFRVLRKTEPALARAFLVELGELAAKEVDTHAGAAMMRSWRSLHRFLAILLIVSVVLHIGVAWYYGFRWVFDQ